MRYAASLALLLAACSGTAPDDTAADGNEALVANGPTAIAATPAPSAPPKPERPRTFRDWAVACDNAKRCTMASLGAEGGDFPQATLALSRAAGPDGGFELAVEQIDDKAPPPTALTVDGRRFTLENGLSGPPATLLATALVNAREVAVVDASGHAIRISPAGSAAALRWIDAAQGRADTITATVARGDRPASDVPVAPALPVVRMPPATAASALSAAQLAEMKRVAACTLPDSVDIAPESARIGDATLVILPCSAGAYNVIGALFVIRDGKVAPAETDAPAGFDATGADSLTPVRSVINGSLDAGVVTSDAKGRGLGDCGLAQRYAWDGTRLRLIEQAEMNECRGNPNFLTTWRARLVR